MVRKLILLAILIGCSFLSSDFVFASSTNIPEAKVKEYIIKHSVELGVDPALALSIAKQESGFCHEKKSRYGAVGVFQLLPSTAKKLGYNPYYLSDNIKGGLKYYLLMYKKFGSMELALAAYNAGPGNVAKYKGMPPFKETKSFVRRIIADYNLQKTNPDPMIKKYIDEINEIEDVDKNVVDVNQVTAEEDVKETNVSDTHSEQNAQNKTDSDLLSMR